MTRTEAKKRRERIARAVRQQASVSDVAQEFGVSRQLVRNACREYGVSWPGPTPHTRRLSKRQVVADLRTGKQPESLAEQYDVPVSRIVSIQERVVSGLPGG